MCELPISELQLGKSMKAAKAKAFSSEINKHTEGFVLIIYTVESIYLCTVQKS